MVPTSAMKRHSVDAYADTFGSITTNDYTLPLATSLPCRLRSAPPREMTRLRNRGKIPSGALTNARRSQLISGWFLGIDATCRQ